MSLSARSSQVAASDVVLTGRHKAEEKCETEEEDDVEEIGTTSRHGVDAGHYTKWLQVHNIASASTDHTWSLVQIERLQSGSTSRL